MMRARGDGFFASVETEPYQPRGVALGQETDDSCVAACCRMLLFDQSPELRDDYHYSESFLRTALETDEDGSLITIIPDVLRDFGLKAQYGHRRDLTLEDLRTSVEVNPAIVFMRGAFEDELHALIVERVEDEFVAIRDPLPEDIGSAYKVSLRSFLLSWLDQRTGHGMATLVLK